jgi:hypothetical protein
MELQIQQTTIGKGDFDSEYNLRNYCGAQSTRRGDMCWIHGGVVSGHIRDAE